MAVRVRRSSQPQAVSVRTTPNAFTIAVRYRPRHASLLVSPFAVAHRHSAGIDVALGGGSRTLGTQTRRGTLTCEAPSPAALCQTLSTPQW
jgi:hypothetical protein